MGERGPQVKRIRYVVSYSNDNRNFKERDHGYGKISKLTALREAAKVARESGWAASVQEITESPTGLVLKNRIIKTYPYKRGK